MTNSERTGSLKRFGYDESEAGFLVKAALHGGYFLRRQYLDFVGGTKGWKDVLLLKKLAANGHCRATAYRHERLVYHLFAKPLYDAMGEADNRNRREHQPSTVKNKIMGLDFVLAHHDYDYLSTEPDRWGYFVRTRHILPEDLPARQYASPRGREPQTKNFVESYPIFLIPRIEPGGQVAPQPHFCYVDEGLQTTDRFATFLNQYGRLFAELGSFHVVYVAETPRLFASAERVFTKFSNTFLDSKDTDDPESQRLLAYFHRRRLYENQDFASFDTASLILFREEKKHFAAESYEALYSHWKVGNLESLAAASRNKTGIQGPSSQHFSTFLLNHDYDLFGTLTPQFQKRRNVQRQTAPSSDPFEAAFDSIGSGGLDKSAERYGQKSG